MKHLNILDLVLRDLMRKRGEQLLFVQIGAHDGLHLDAVRPYVETFHWPGVLVEPQPKLFERLVANYRHEPQLRFVNAAICAVPGPAKLFTFADSQLPDHATMLASFHAPAIHYNGHQYQGNIAVIEVPTLTLGELLANYQISRLDFLQIDAEGYDFEILKMLHGSAVLPEAINFESAMLSAEDQEACREMLGAMGYRLAQCGIDTIAYRQPNDFPKREY